MSFETSLRETARSLRAHDVPATLRERILNGIPGKSYRSSGAFGRLGPALACLIALVILCILGLLKSVSVHSNRMIGSDRALAAEVSSAVDKANTWRFDGWQLDSHHHRVPWTVWGRRSPFFYREEIGDDVLVDDGTRRTHLLPPDPANGRQRGLCLILPSQAKSSIALSPNAGLELLVNISGSGNEVRVMPHDWGENGVLTSSTEEMGYPDVKETTAVTVDRKTFLPTGYVVTRLESKPGGSLPGHLDFTHLTPIRTYQEAQLSPQYDVAIPADIADVQRPAGYVVADATGPPPTPGEIHAPAQSIATKDGLTLCARVVGRDAEGDVHTRLTGWLGQQPIAASVDNLLWLQAATPNLSLGTDNLGNKYIWIYDPPLRGVDDAPDVWLVPLKPLASVEAPSRLTFEAEASLYYLKQMPFGTFGVTHQAISVLNDTMQLTVPLPATEQDLGYDGPQNPGITIVGIRATLKLTADEARASYFSTQAWMAGDQTGQSHYLSKIFHGAKAESYRARAVSERRIAEADAAEAGRWYAAAAVEALHLGDRPRALNDRTNSAQAIANVGRAIAGR